MLSTICVPLAIRSVGHLRGGGRRRKKGGRTNGAEPQQASAKRKESSSSSVSNFEPESSSNDESSSVWPPPAKIRTKTKRVPVNKEETAALGSSESVGGSPRGEYRCRLMKETVFQTWQALLSAFDDYCEATHQPFRKRSSISASSRNKVGKRTWRYPVEPEEENLYQIIFVCTHGWSTRSRGKGIRPMQNFRGCDCKAQIIATLKRIKVAENQFGFAVYVTKQHTTHTHPLNGDAWRAYAENRRVEDPEIIEMVRKFVAVDSKFGKIHRYVIDNTGTQVNM
ncbi:hypothetical protein GN244_ATG12341 [Phytophthora infestans]|uniref:FAR1 domain-containing protein n=1 Tax=Phytophthora infestans TaxID=4787 RepID=A0A833WHY3_PHYIN|nr:hypothetical protein GN244_ATG12341 [Phytophthora infestans]